MTNELRDEDVGGEEWSDQMLWVRSPVASHEALATLIASNLKAATNLPQRADVEVKSFSSGWSCVRFNRWVNGSPIAQHLAFEGAFLLSFRHPQRQWRLCENSWSNVVAQLPAGALSHPVHDLQLAATQRLSEFVGHPLSKPEEFVDWMERWGDAKPWDVFTVVFDGATLDSARRATEFGHFTNWQALRKDALQRRIHGSLAVACVVAAALGFPTYVYFHTFRPPAEGAATALVIFGLLAFLASLESLVTWEFTGRPVRWVVRLFAFQIGNIIAAAVGAGLAVML